MPRPQRIEFAGAWYHVLNAGHEAIFTRPAYITRFLEVVQDCVSTYGIHVHAWYVGKNRYDLLVSTPLGNLSTAMRHINSVFTQDLNRMQQNAGGLFKGRYKAVLIDASEYAWAVSRYIHHLPTQYNRCKAPRDYNWSSLPCYTHKFCATPFVDTVTLLSLSHANDPRRAYLSYMQEGVDEATGQFYARKNLRSLRAVPGFLKQQAQISRINGIQRPVDLKKIAQRTADHFAVTIDSLYTSMRGPRGGNIPRAVSMLIGREAGHYTLKEIADFYRIDDVSTVSVTIKRLKIKCASQQSLLKKIQSLKESIVNAEKYGKKTTPSKKPRTEKTRNRSGRTRTVPVA